ncbi:GAP family protein [Mycobacterium intermedium]|nr:GAP family protein [Mycobacterium intermedium]MCV6964237.1 GAP family protein [Mycobacterium intermedium]
MWVTIMALALLATADPVRIGVSVVLSSPPHAVRQLPAFWLGGIAMCVVIAAGALYGMHDSALSVMRWAAVGTASSTGGRIQIAMGVLALLVAGLAVGLSPRRRERMGLPEPSAPAVQTFTSNTAGSVSARALTRIFRETL